MSGPQLRLDRVYLKDVSFESPASPEIFTASWKPEMQVDINTRTNRVGENHFEVVLSATINARRDEERVGFIVEVQQAGLFFIQGLEDEQLHRALGTLCPTNLFPYLRETIDGLVVKGGFPPLHLAAVNFEALYAQAVKQRAEQAAAAADGAVKH